MFENLSSLITVGEAARLLSLSDSSVRKMADAGRLPVAASVGRSAERLFEKRAVINIAIAKAIGLEGTIDFTRPSDVARLADAIEKCSSSGLSAVIPVVQVLLPEIGDAARSQLAAAVMKSLRREGPTTTRLFGVGESGRAK